MNLPYNRRDYESIFNWLKDKAQELSEYRWTDFSEGDIGTIMIHLMSYLADMNNFNIDASTNELFLDTALERSSIMSILTLIGYKPRHFEAATCKITLADPTNTEVVTIPAFTAFSDEEDSITYTTLVPQAVVGEKGEILAYEGIRKRVQCTISNIDSLGRIFLPDYNVAFNTASLYISTLSATESIKLVEDVRFESGDMCFSLHVTNEGSVYIQLPSYWKDIIDSSSSININYLATNGAGGRVGKDVICKVKNATTKSNSELKIYNVEPSEGGYNPETVAELKVRAPIAARTMYTIVTINDFNEVPNLVEEISQVKAGDYNDEWTGYVQPDDYYKVTLLAVPQQATLSSLYEDEEHTKLNDAGEIFKEFIDDRRVASLFVEYKDPEYILPNIDIDLYMNENDLRVESIASEVVETVRNFFGRDHLRIGESVYGSVIGTVIHVNYPYISYCEVHSPEYNIECEPTQFIDMENASFVVRVNDVQKYPVIPSEDKFRTYRIPFGWLIDYRITGSVVKTLEYIVESEWEEYKHLVPSDIKITWEGTDMMASIPVSWYVNDPYPPTYVVRNLFAGQSLELPHGEVVVYIPPEEYHEGMVPPGILVSYVDETEHIMLLQIPPYYMREV